MIRDIHLAHPDWPAKSFVIQLQEDFGWSPEERAIQKHRKKGMDNLKDKRIFELLRPWNMCKLDDYPIPPEAIPHVLKAQQFMHGILTVWQVKWIARLYTIPHFRKDIRSLWKASIIYAAYELSCEFANVKVDTSYLDKDVASKKWEDTFTEWMKGQEEKVGNEAMDWIMHPKVKFGHKTWEELEKLYTEEKYERTHNTTE